MLSYNKDNLLIRFILFKLHLLIIIKGVISPKSVTIKINLLVNICHYEQLVIGPNLKPFLVITIGQILAPVWRISMDIH